MLGCPGGRGRAVPGSFWQCRAAQLPHSLPLPGARSGPLLRPCCQWQAVGRPLHGSSYASCWQLRAQTLLYVTSPAAAKSPVLVSRHGIACAVWPDSQAAALYGCVLRERLTVAHSCTDSSCQLHDCCSLLVASRLLQSNAKGLFSSISTPTAPAALPICVQACQLSSSPLKCRPPQSRWKCRAQALAVFAGSTCKVALPFLVLLTTSC